jgi:RND family efflux transporter MFP subunit
MTVVASVIVLIVAGTLTAVLMSRVPEDGDADQEATVSVIEASPGVVAVRVEGPSVVEPYRVQELRATVSATVLSVAAVGETVSEGSVVVSFDPTNLLASRQQSELSLSQAELDRDRAALTLDQARATLADRERLFADGAIAREQVEAAGDTVRGADISLRSAEIRVAQAQLAVESAERAARAAQITAPFSGVVIASGVVPGETAGPGTLLVTLADLSRVRLTAEVDEYDIGKIEANMQVEVSSDALAGETIRSRVERISPVAEIVNNISIFTVTTVVDNSEGLLRPGMSADLSVLVSSDRGLLVPSKVVSTVRGRSYLDIYDGTEVKTIRVTAGADDGVNTAILEGLEEGALVVVPAASGLILTSSAPDAGSSIISIPVPGTGGGSR